LEQLGQQQELELEEQDGDHEQQELDCQDGQHQEQQELEGQDQGGQLQEWS